MKNFKVLVLTVVAVLALSSCGTTQTVPLTGRTHRIAVLAALVDFLAEAMYFVYS